MQLHKSRIIIVYPLKSVLVAVLAPAHLPWTHEFVVVFRELLVNEVAVLWGRVLADLDLQLQLVKAQFEIFASLLLEVVLGTGNKNFLFYTNNDRVHFEVLLGSSIAPASTLMTIQLLFLGISFLPERNWLSLALNSLSTTNRYCCSYSQGSANLGRSLYSSASFVISS